MLSKTNLTNTHLRILSSFAMVGILVCASYLGKWGMWSLGLVIGVFAIDEFIHNMANVKRESLSYITAQLTLIIPYILVGLNQLPIAVFAWGGTIFSFLMLGYLFFTNINSKRSKAFILKNIWGSGLIFVFPFSCLAWILNQEKAMDFIVFAILVNSVVDIGGWFFGKNFGKNKLWPTVSPNKTIEGSLGGIISSALIGTLFSYYVLGYVSIWLILGLLILGAISQSGDLFQSKLKRQFNIKDSSNLIPGHGGVYDRIDSLVFVLPFFTLMVLYIYQG